MNVTIRDNDAHEAASMYYLQGETMETIARHLGVSRSSVSRLLRMLANPGLSASVLQKRRGAGYAAGELNQIFGIHTTVVRVRDFDTGVNRL